MARTIIVVGDSHWGALNHGLVELNKQARGRRFANDINFLMPDIGTISRELLLDLADGRRILNPLLVKAFHSPVARDKKPLPAIINRWTNKSDLASIDHQLFILWGFAEMHIFAFEREWSAFGVNGEPEINETGADPERYFLPRALIKARLEELIAPVLQVVLYLIERGIRVATLAGPPPVPTNEAISSKFTPAAPQTRIIIYKMILEIFQNHSTRHNYHFHKAPEAVCDEFGFLRQEFWGDSMHANAAYGGEMLHSLASILNGTDAL